MSPSSSPTTHESRPPAVISTGDPTPSTSVITTSPRYKADQCSSGYGTELLSVQQEPHPSRDGGSTFASSSSSSLSRLHRLSFRPQQRSETSTPQPKRHTLNPPGARNTPLSERSNSNPLYRRKPAPSFDISPSDGSSRNNQREDSQRQSLKPRSIGNKASPKRAASLAKTDLFAHLPIEFRPSKDPKWITGGGGLRGAEGGIISTPFPSNEGQPSVFHMASSPSPPTFSGKASGTNNLSIPTIAAARLLRIASSEPKNGTNTISIQSANSLRRAALINSQNSANSDASIGLSLVPSSYPSSVASSVDSRLNSPLTSPEPLSYPNGASALPATLDIPGDFSVGLIYTTADAYSKCQARPARNTPSSVRSSPPNLPDKDIHRTRRSAHAPQMPTSICPISSASSEDLPILLQASESATRKRTEIHARHRLLPTPSQPLCTPATATSLNSTNSSMPPMNISSAPVSPPSATIPIAPKPSGAARNGKRDTTAASISATPQHTPPCASSLSSLGSSAQEPSQEHHRPIVLTSGARTVSRAPASTSRSAPTSASGSCRRTPKQLREWAVNNSQSIGCRLAPQPRSSARLGQVASERKVKGEDVFEASTESVREEVPMPGSFDVTSEYKLLKTMTTVPDQNQLELSHSGDHCNNDDLLLLVIIGWGINILENGAI